MAEQLGRSVFFALLLVIIFLSSCQQKKPDDLFAYGSGLANPWTNLEANNDSRNFQFAIIADRTGGMRSGIFEDAVDKLNLLGPEFVVSVGDLIDGNTEDAEVLTKQWDQFDAIVDKLEMPFFYLAGNHDLTNGTMQDLWTRRLGRTYYHFIYRDVLFLCLNTQDPPGTKGSISDAQMSYFREVLRTHEQKDIKKRGDVRWTMIVMHKPLWKKQFGGQQNWQKFETMLGQRPCTFIAGHVHHYTKEVRRGRSYYTLATTGGSSSLKGVKHGSFDHIVWGTMTDDGPRLANIELDGIYDDDPTEP
jgi:3',5'-cyclic AMP phosphodiesterase CpdA